MDIQQAIGQVEGAVRAYVAKDGRGLPLIPTHMQRPVFLYGPPGVGKPPSWPRWPPNWESTW